MFKYDTAKNFDILTISLSVLHNNFYNLTKLFSDLYSAKAEYRFKYFSETVFFFFLYKPNRFVRYILIKLFIVTTTKKNIFPSALSDTI